MVTLAGLEPATSPTLPENKDALSPLALSYSVVTIFMTVCGGAGASDRFAGVSSTRNRDGTAGVAAVKLSLFLFGVWRAASVM